MRESESITERKRSRSSPPPRTFPSISARRNAISRKHTRFETVRELRRVEQLCNSSGNCAEIRYQLRREEEGRRKHRR